MSLKIIKRILYGVFGVALLVVGGKELLATGLNLSSAMGLGVGIIFGFMAATGAG